MRVLDLFSGIGGFSLGLEAAGMTTTAFCEREPFCQAVLKKHWPDVPCHDDVTTLDGKQYAGRIDVICGGFPCQDISLAGKGAGLAGERSGLWFEYLRIIKEVQPRYVIIENVSALRSRGLEAVLGTLHEIGYNAEWHCITAKSVGAPHQRDRIWIVAYPQGKRYTCGEPENETGQERKIESGWKAKGLRFAEPSNKSGISNVANADHTGLQGRISAELQERSRKRAAWTGNPSMANAYSEPPQWIAESRMQCDPWITEPGMGRSFDGLSHWMDRLDISKSHKLVLAYANAKKERPEEILSALRCGINQTDIWESFGRSGSVSSEEVLFAYLCKLEERWAYQTRIQLESEETSQKVLRGMQSDKKSSCPSPRSKNKKQRSVKHPDTLQKLSQFLACYAEKAWVEYCRENAVPRGWEEGINRVAYGLSGRVDRIKSLGNSIVPQIAQIIGQAIIESNKAMNNCCSKCGEEEISPSVEAFEISGELLCDECAEEVFEENSQYGVGA